MEWNGLDWTEMDWTSVTELGYLPFTRVSTPGFLVSPMFIHICY